MFQSYNSRYLDWDEVEQVHEYECNIVDDAFEDNKINIKVRYSDASMVGWVAIVVSITTAIINTYSKRNLNVASNLALFFQFVNRDSQVSSSLIATFNKIHNPKYLPYADDVEKYLIWA